MATVFWFFYLFLTVIFSGLCLILWFNSMGISDLDLKPVVWKILYFRMILDCHFFGALIFKFLYLSPYQFVYWLSVHLYSRHGPHKRSKFYQILRNAILERDLWEKPLSSIIALTILFSKGPLARTNKTAPTNAKTTWQAQLSKHSNWNLSSHCIRKDLDSFN